MPDWIEDTVNFGFGLFAYSREKLEALVEKLVDAGKVKKQDAQSFMQDLVQKGEEERKDVKAMIKKEVDDAADTLRGKSLTEEDVRRIIREELANAKND